LANIMKHRKDSSYHSMLITKMIDILIFGEEKKNMNSES
jgi:hypothetical protein